MPPSKQHTFPSQIPGYCIFLLALFNDARSLGITIPEDLYNSVFGIPDDSDSKSPDADDSDSKSPGCENPTPSSSWPKDCGECRSCKERISDEKTIIGKCLRFAIDYVDSVTIDMFSLILYFKEFARCFNDPLIPFPVGLIGIRPDIESMISESDKTSSFYHSIAELASFARLAGIYLYLDSTEAPWDYFIGEFRKMSQQVKSFSDEMRKFLKARLNPFPRQIEFPDPDALGELSGQDDC